MSTPDETFTQGRQGASYARHETLHGVHVRVRIERDLYPDQCFAVVEAFNADDLEWKRLRTVPSNLVHARLPRETGDDALRAFREVAGELRAAAAELLAGSRS